MADYVDILISGDSIALDNVGLPLTVEGRASIAQDIKRIKRNMVRIEQAVENDARIRPGTARMTRLNNDTFFITAKTMKYGDLEVYL